MRFLGAANSLGSAMNFSFQNHLTNAANVHATEMQLRRGDDGQDLLVAMVRGDAALMATLDAMQSDAVLAQAFAACDGGGDYVAGTARMMRMTGESVTLPKGVTQILMQFMADGGARRLVARISYDGDVCCGSCGGG